MLGSFNCSCRTGFSLASNGFSCNGKNADNNVHTCFTHTYKQQTPHAHTHTHTNTTCTCTHIHTPHAHVHTYTHTISIQCFSLSLYSLDIDECTLSTDSCGQTCHNTPGSYTCSCDPGYSLDLDRLGCTGTQSHGGSVDIPVSLSVKYLLYNRQ